MAYNVVSNAILWFCHHHLFDSARRPRADGHWMTAWDGLSRAEPAVRPTGGQGGTRGRHGPGAGLPPGPDGRGAGGLRPDLRTAHFTHTPFADPSVLRMLPDIGGDRAASAMEGFGSCGFHTERWAPAYRQGLPAPRYRRRSACRPTFVSPLSTDPDQLRASVAQPAVGRALTRIEEQIGGADRQVIVRVDRMELSKNLLRGFWAFEELLEAAAPARTGRVRGPGLSHPAGTGRVPGLPERGGEHGVPHQPAVGTTRMDADRARGRRRLPAVAGRPDPLRRPAGESGPGRDEPGGQGGSAGQHPQRGAGPVPRGRGLRRAGVGVGRDQPVRRVRDGGGVGRGPRHGAGPAAAQAGELRKLILARHPSDWLSDQLDAAR